MNVDFAGWIRTWLGIEKSENDRLQQIVTRDTEYQNATGTARSTLTDEAQAAANQVTAALDRAREAFLRERSGPIAKAHRSAIEGAALLAEQTAASLRTLEAFEYEMGEFYRRTKGRPRARVAHADLPLLLADFAQRARRAIEEPRPVQTAIRRVVKALDFSDLLAR